VRIDRQLQLQLAHELRAILEGWTLSEIVARTGMYPARVSELRHGDLARYSIAKLVCLIASRGHDIEVVIRPTKLPLRARQRAAATVVRYDRFGQPASTSTGSPRQ
jgi:predicted XRE-type DNA-binding protein